MTAYVGAIDQGTTGTRFVVFDEAGRAVASAYETHEQRYPRPGWVEHDPEELWTNTRAVVGRALDAAEIDPGRLSAIGLTNQRETTVLWETETGTPVSNAIVWQDRRTTERIERLEAEGKSAWIRETTGLEPDAYFSASKLEWLLDDAAVRERAERGDLSFGTVDSWLLANLTGDHATDVTNASRTMLFDVHDLAWDDALLAEFDVPRAVLPTVRPSVDPDGYGTTDPDVVGAEIPVTAVIGDQQASLFGHACFDAGDAKNTYGTGSFVLVNTGTDAVASDHGLLTTVAFQRAGDPARYALEGSIFVTGAAVEWLADVNLVADPEETDRLARSVDSTDGVYFVPAFSGLGAPHWNQRARGTLVGLTRGTRREHVVRATLEAVAFRTREVLDAMAADCGRDVTGLRVDGGAARNDALCGIQADALGVPVRRSAQTETTALGAAFAAGLGAGVWESEADLRETWRADRVFDPDPDPSLRFDRWREAVDRSLDWAE
ncbi:glycerol kinase GlpK [Salinirarus marinus]|uniref:glycerol kinase GlpK n=1 Tax=Salinirarus marinus TaxID=3068310 RepID=UPI003C6C2939